MTSFVGVVNLNKDISKEIHIVKDMNLKLQKNQAAEKGYYSDASINLGYTKKITSTNEKVKQPISIKYNNVTYTMVYNGQIYNKDEIKKELQELGYEFSRRFRYRIIVKGIYSFWN